MSGSTRGKDVGPLSVNLSQYALPKDAEEVLECLYQAVVAKIGEFDAWYLRDKRRKRRASRGLRASAIACAAAGGLWPLIAASAAAALSPSWGYVLLALAASIVAFDRFFGLSLGWMRDIAAHNRLVALHSSLLFAWTARKLSPHPATPETTGARLDLLSEVVVELNAIVAAESTDWTAQFSSQVELLESSVASSGDQSSKSP